MKKAGCKLKRGFFLSTDGQDFKLLSKLRGQGYKELYYTAPYHWAVIDPKTKKIFSYTEGDTAESTCSSKASLIKEADKHIKFMKKMGHSPSTWREGEDIIKKMRKDKRTKRK
jgi:hypothetical protein